MSESVRVLGVGTAVVFVGMMTIGCAAADAGGSEVSAEQALLDPTSSLAGQYELDQGSRVCSREKTPVDVRQPNWGAGQRQFFNFRLGPPKSFDFRAYAPNSGTCWAQVSGAFSLDEQNLHVPTQSSSSSCSGRVVLAASHSFEWMDASAQSFRLASSAAEIGHNVCPRGYPWLLTTFARPPSPESH
jgi:hypothetical protein